METIPLSSLILYSFPESIIYICLGLTLFGQHIRPRLRQILIYSVILVVAVYYIHQLPLPFGLIMAIKVITYIGIAAVSFRLSIKKAFFMTMIIVAVSALTESIIPPLIMKVLGLNIKQVLGDPVLRIAIPWVHLTVLAFLTWFLAKRQISFLPAFSYLEPKTPGGKLTLWLIGIILFQAILGLSIYSVFYINAFSNTATFAIFKSIWLSRLLAVLLIVLPVISIFIVKKLFTLVEKENIIAGQEAFIDNVNNLFNIIRAQRHDFLNHVQILDSYLKLGRLEDAKAYMKDILEETKDINDIIVVKSPVINALIQAKMGLTQRYKIDFQLKIDSDLELVGIKPFDLVKILGNLLNNAIEAVKDLEPAHRQVRLSVKKDGNSHIIEVFNAKPVIPADNIKKIFTGGFTTKKEKDNCGLGLVVVKKLTEKYNGAIEVHSTETAGTTFTVRFK